MRPSVSPQAPVAQVTPRVEGFLVPDPESGADADGQDGRVLDNEHGEHGLGHDGRLAVGEAAGRLPLAQEDRIATNFLLPQLGPLGKISMLVEVAANQQGC